jgi:hypothetical protein
LDCFSTYNVVSLFAPKSFARKIFLEEGKVLAPTLFTHVGAVTCDDTERQTNNKAVMKIFFKGEQF